MLNLELLKKNGRDNGCGVFGLGTRHSLTDTEAGGGLPCRSIVRPSARRYPVNNLHSVSRNRLYSPSTAVLLHSNRLDSNGQETAQ